MQRCLATLLSLCSACGQRTVGSEGEAEAEGQSEGEAEAEGEGVRTLSVAIGPIDVAPLDEQTRCIVAELDVTAAAHVVSLSADLSPTTHHIIFYRAADSTPVSSTPAPCQPFGEVTSGDAPLLIAQNSTQRVDMPSGVAFTLFAHQKVRFEMHYINTDGSQTRQATATVRLDTVAAAAVAQTADLLFYGTAGFFLPPHQMSVVGPDFWTVPAGAKVFALTGHTHRLGTEVTVEKAAGASAAGQVVYGYDNWSWEEPPLEVLSPPVEFASGEGLRWTCSYDNTTNQLVTFGESALDEMCFIWAWYYPASGGFLTHVATP
jgi:copper type II ascorbate-dependent monooxygenase-like protein